MQRDTSEARLQELLSIRLNCKMLRKATITGTGLLILLTLAVVRPCGWLGIRSRMDVMGYRAMMQEHCPPSWKDLACRRIRKGDSLDSLLQRHPPMWREDFGPYVHLSCIMPPDFNWPEIAAKDGRLIDAQAGRIYSSPG